MDKTPTETDIDLLIQNQQARLKQNAIQSIKLEVDFERTQDFIYHLEGIRDLLLKDLSTKGANSSQGGDK